MDGGTPAAATRPSQDIPERLGLGIISFSQCITKLRRSRDQEPPPRGARPADPHPVGHTPFGLLRPVGLLPGSGLVVSTEVALDTSIFEEPHHHVVSRAQRLFGQSTDPGGTSDFQAVVGTDGAAYRFRKEPDLVHCNARSPHRTDQAVGSSRSVEY